MFSAYVLIKAEMEHSVAGLLEGLKKVKGVTSIDRVLGFYSMIARVEAETERELELVRYKIRGEDGVMETRTLPIVE